MLQQIFTAATFLIGIFGMGGAAVIVAIVVYLTPAIALPMLGAAFTRFVGCAKCVAIVVFVVSTTGAYWVGHHGEYRRGYDAAISAIAEEDAAAITRATEMRSAWRSCRARNGQWDQSTGECS